MQLPVNSIENELKIFEVKFKDAASSHVSMLDRIMRYVVKRKGKQLRPMFVFLSAKLCGEINESTYRAASLVELLHTATLVHDDVVDDSLERRGFFSVYALWKNKVSVLVGDYLLAKGLLLSLDNDDFRILKILSDAVRQIEAGDDGDARAGMPGNRRRRQRQAAPHMGGERTDVAFLQVTAAQ